MKIKLTKEFKLLELIEYIKKNEIADKVFFDKKGKGKVVVGDDRHLYMTDLNLTDTFIVEVEEEITEDTILPSLLVVHKDEDYIGATHWKYRSIRSLKEKLVSSDIKPMAFYVLHHDASMTLIYKSGGMVE
ncbi:hypothetical protein [Staphylococcus pseudintermedius]|uniref:hypothetical protein n=1 Tax=Staphylococcus pseudintermedius TaxID=283734 RepID=UPI001BDEEDA8|nr:hypothetical protein [Staphylococcus pseudintermedius]